MSRKSLKIWESAYRKVIQAASEAWPLECCGAMLGVASEGATTLMEAIPADGPETRTGADHFQIGGPDMVRFQRCAAGRGAAVLGFYHSHPDAPPVPSAADLAGASWPEAFLLIASVYAGRFEALRAFALVGNDAAEPRFEAVPLEIVADPSQA